MSPVVCPKPSSWNDWYSVHGVREVRDSENLRTRTSERPNQIKEMSLKSHSRNPPWIGHSAHCLGFACNCIKGALGHIKINDIQALVSRSLQSETFIKHLLGKRNGSLIWGVWRTHTVCLQEALMLPRPCAHGTWRSSRIKYWVNNLFRSLGKERKLYLNTKFWSCGDVSDIILNSYYPMQIPTQITCTHVLKY